MRQSDDPRNAFTGQSERGWVPVAAAVAANVALAFGPLFVRLSDTGPVAAAFWRIALAVPVLLALGWRIDRAGMVEGVKRYWAVLALAGVAFAADLASWHVGIERTVLANATLFGNSATLIFPIYGFLVARSWPNRWQVTALALALGGAGLLLGRSAQVSTQHLAGDLYCLLAGVLYAVYFMGMAKVRERLSPVPTLALASVASIAPLLLLALWLGETIVPHDWTPLIALALGSQLIGQGLMVYALGRLSPLLIGMALLLQPIVGGAIGWILYDERLGVPDFLGAAMVAAALVLVRKGRSVPAELAPPAIEPHLGEDRRI